jgi:predicted metalloprotease with PDZ domain
MKVICTTLRLQSIDLRTAGTLFAFLALIAFPAWGESANYKVHVDFDRPLHATVEAQIEVTDGAIFTPEHAGGYAWWEFTKNPRQVRDDGTSVPLQPAGDGHWVLPASAAGLVRLNYEVDLAFTEKVRVGDLRGGLFFGDSLYLVNRALFLMSNAAGPKDIEFDVPLGFAIATPWEKIGDHRFRASDNRELTENWTILGRFPGVEFKEGRFQVTFVFPGVSATEQSLLQPLFKPVLHEYLRIFPQTPATHLSFAFFHGAEENGEGFLSSTTLTMVDPITIEDRILWTSLLAHEIFHHWNGGLLVPLDDEETTWFTEGVTEYMANRAIIRTGLISQQLFLKKLEIHVGMYGYWMWAPPFQKSSIQSAVKDAGGDKNVNRPAVYNGGVVAAFCLDTIIQKQTAGRNNLEDLLRRMLTRYGLTVRQWSTDDLIHDASEVAGTDLSSFFSRYIASRERLPVKQCFADAGFDIALADYAGEAFISPQAHSSRSARGIREQLTQQHMLAADLSH